MMDNPGGGGDANHKAVLRAGALACRNALGDADRAVAAESIAIVAGEILEALRPATVALYLPIGSECPTAPLMATAVSLGAGLCLPAVVDQTTLVFRRYSPGDRLVPGGFGTRAPETHAPPVQPDVIVVPIVAFDRRGARVGYGRGHYDRAITALREAGQRPLLLGIAFSAQEVERIPAEPHDVHLDWVVTEKETLALRTSRG